MGRPEERRYLGRSRLRKKDNILTDLQAWNGSVNWIDLAQHRDKWQVVVSVVTNFWVP